jgi:hypothetical protein
MLIGILMSKKAIIVVNLVQEASEASHNQIESEILKDAQIPWCKEVIKVKISNEK